MNTRFAGAMPSKILYTNDVTLRTACSRFYLIVIVGDGSHFVFPDTNVLMSRQDFKSRIYNCEVSNDCVSVTKPQGESEVSTVASIELEAPPAIFTIKNR